MSDAPRLRTSCPSCGVRYRIDSSRLKGSQANIKCSSCGTVFRVRVGQPSREASAPWVVVRADSGRELAVPSLDTVQRLIIEGKVNADDTLGRGTGAPRRIGDIEQFQPFLRVGERSGAFQGLVEVEVAASGDRDVSPPSEHAPEVAIATDRALAREAEETEALGEGPDQVDDGEDAEAAEEAEVDDAAGAATAVEVEVEVDDAAGADAAVDEAAEEAEAEAGDRDQEEDEGSAEDEAEDPTEPRPLLESVADEPLEHDEPIHLETGTGRRVALALLVVVVLLLAALGAIYVAAPDTFYELFPFLK